MNAERYMKAMLLAAGEGTRLRPLTLNRPKPMIEVAGAPILEHNVRLLVKHGFREIVINVSHLAHIITAHFGDGASLGASITYSFEDTPLGTAGALKRVAHVFEEDFLLVYGDNVSTCDLGSLMQLHRAKQAAATVAVFERDRAEQSGVVTMDTQGMVVRFEEKPVSTSAVRNWVNAGILAVAPRLLDAIPDRVPSDFSRDVLEPAVRRGERIFAFRMPEGLWWIDSIEDYEQTRRYFAQPTAAAVLRGA